MKKSKMDYIEQANELMEHTGNIEKVSDAIKRKQETTKNVNVIITGDSIDNWKVNPMNNFVILFYDNFQELLLNYNLTKVDIVILLEILKLMHMGNQVQITQQQIVKNTGKNKCQVSLSWKKFVKYNILITTNAGSKFINPQLIVKGSLKKISDSDNFDELSSKSDYQNYTKNSFKKNYKKN